VFFEAFSGPCWEPFEGFWLEPGGSEIEPDPQKRCSRCGESASDEKSTFFMKNQGLEKHAFFMKKKVQKNVFFKAVDSLFGTSIFALILVIFSDFRGTPGRE